jgi:hypothetical protein
MTPNLIDALGNLAQFLIPAAVIAWADRPRAPGVKATR